MVRMITIAIAIALPIALLPSISMAAVASHRACEGFAVTRHHVGASEYTKFVTACAARNFRGYRKEAAEKWAACVNRRVDNERPDSTDDWQKIMTACLLAGR